MSDYWSGWLAAGVAVAAVDVLVFGWLWRCSLTQVVGIWVAVMFVLAVLDDGK